MATDEQDELARLSLENERLAAENEQLKLTAWRAQIARKLFLVNWSQQPDGVLRAVWNLAAPVEDHPAKVEADAEVVKRAPWVMVHDDNCGAFLDKNGTCPKCGFHPDGQSVALQQISFALFTASLKQGCTFLGQHRLPIG